MQLNEKAYNWLKWFTLIALPAISSLYFGMANVWDLPSAEDVVGSIALLMTFLGSVLGISTKAYNKADADYAGEIQVSEDDGKTIMGLVVNPDVEDFPDRKRLTFKVVHTDQIPRGFAE